MGVSLVGYSGSLIKDAIKNDLMTFLDPNTTETSESTKVVLGKLHFTEHPPHLLNKTRYLFRPVRSALVGTTPWVTVSAYSDRRDSNY
jgi:hypothetical protein